MERKLSFFIKNNLVIFLVTLFCSISSQLMALEGTSVTVNMGIHIFSWTFDKPVTYGYFVDGQPWIIVPVGGINLTAAVPARINGANVYNPYTGAAVVADINQTVVNPPIGTSYNNNAGPIITKYAFGWDSRGAIRYATASVIPYDKNLGWDGVTPKPLVAGDIVTTAKSITTNGSGIETCIDAVGVLTVLASAPPTDAFRPGVVRNTARRANPEFMTLSQMIDLTPNLIQKPLTSVLGAAIATTLPTPFNASTLTNLMPGPSILIEGLNNGRSFKSKYNDSGFTYGGDVASATGDLAIGALAAWLTPEQRKICQINFIQRAIDTYEVLKSGGVLTHNGGHLPGYGVLITIAGKMLNNAGMLSINQSVNGREPLYFMSDYSQVMYVEKPGLVEPNTPAVGSLRRTSVATNKSSIQKLTLPITAVGTGTLTVNPTFLWPPYRAAREVINMKIRIESGAGAGDQYYVVTGITNYTTSSGGAATAATDPIAGGILSVKPAWVNGTPNATSVFKSYAVVPAEVPFWAFKSGGVNSTGVYNEDFSLSPTTDYGDINLGAYISYICALYAMNAQNDYSSGIDRWMINTLKIPGYGPYIFSSASSRYMFLPNGDSKTPGSSFISGIWRDQVLNKVGLTNFSKDASLTSLPIPATDQSLTNVVTEIDDAIFKINSIKSKGTITFESTELVESIDIFSVTGAKLHSLKINNYTGTIQLKEKTNTILLIKVTLKDKIMARKFIVE
jgi:hypothetical protein